jgi:CRP-like cAMP-binding protein
MSDFIQFCNQLAPLGQEAGERLADKAKYREFRPGDYLLKEGTVCRHLFFMETGLAKMFFTNGAREFIMRFFPQNALFTQLESFIAQAPSTYSILALEPSSVTAISHDDLEALCKQHHSIETFFRKLLSVASLNMMHRISEMLEENPAQRYHNFVSHNPELLQRISLGDLANYLGISQVSLSRIRARK